MCATALQCCQTEWDSLGFPKLSTTNNGDNGNPESIVKRNSCLFQASRLSVSTHLPLCRPHTLSKNCPSRLARSHNASSYSSLYKTHRKPTISKGNLWAPVCADLQKYRFKSKWMVPQQPADLNVLIMNRFSVGEGVTPLHLRAASIRVSIKCGTIWFQHSINGTLGCDYESLACGRNAWICFWISHTFTHTHTHTRIMHSHLKGTANVSLASTQHRLPRPLHDENGVSWPILAKLMSARFAFWGGREKTLL